MVGREMGVGIELAVLVVAFVLTLLRPSDVRDCGRRIPVGIWLCDSALGGRLSAGEFGVAELRGRKEEGAVGPDRLRYAFSLSLSGDGVSSIIKTQPEVLPTGVWGFSRLRSRLWAFGFDIIGLSGDGDRSEDLELEAEGERTEEGPALAAGMVEPELVVVRLVTLPIRMRGTRVCIFCPSTSTRARISESIWTPLLVPAVVAEVLLEEKLRWASGRAYAAREVVDGCVLDRAIGEEMLYGCVELVERGLKPAR